MSDQLEFYRAEIKERFSKAKKEKMYVYRANEQDEKAFEKAAKFCLDNNLSPTIYVEAHIENQDIIKFRANYLNKSDSLEIYKWYHAATFITEVDLAGMYQSQLVYLKGQISMGFTVEKILMDDQIDFKPWFRMLITKEPIPNVIDKYKKHLLITQDLLDFLKTKPNFDLTRLDLPQELLT